MNAVNDALARIGAIAPYLGMIFFRKPVSTFRDHASVQMPATPEKVWRAIQAAPGHGLRNNKATGRFF
jgi:hypothetical protein